MKKQYVEIARKHWERSLQDGQDRLGGRAISGCYEVTVDRMGGEM